MKVKDFLTEENWTKAYFATDQNGKSCDANDECASKFCLYGAVMKCYYNELDNSVMGNVVKRIKDYIWKKMSFISISSFNDENNFPQVKTLLEDLDI